MKPILFNTEMVRALLDGRKTVTRRVVKYTANDVYDAACVNLLWNEAYDPKNPPGGLIALYVKHMKKSPYQSGDILYVRETWQEKRGGGYLYKADTVNSFDLFVTPDGRVVSEIPWRPSIHMPKEAARIFLRVTDVRVGRLQDITDDDIVAEGLKIGCHFDELWDKTIKPTDHALYGWAANPWVWVIEFERISREEALRNE